jgi:NAD(P)-dependent dehydrogenase (short-subunit alcohol dehydrogenase family)
MAGLDGRVVIITGAGGGLGREYALLLADEGARVVVNDLGGARDGSGSGPAMADTVVDEIRQLGGTALANYDDIATEDGARSLVEAALREFGTLDGVVNNAGILRDGAFHKMSTQNWDAVVKVHLYGGFHVTRAAWTHLREKKFGRIVMATSTSGIFGNFGQANYGAAKLGLVGLINTLAIEGAKYGILANAVAPMAATRMTADVAPPELLDKLPPAQVAPVVGYLMSEQCTDSGSVYIVGGGNIQRVAQFQNKGVSFSEPPTVDELTARWSEISDLSNVEVGTNPLG